MSEENQGSDTFSNNQLNIDSLPKLEELSYTGVKSSYLRLWLLKWSFFLIAPPIGFYFIPNLPDKIRILVYVIYGFILIYSIVDKLLAFKRIGYALREHDINFRKGWFFRSLTSIPFSRIQHCEVEQGPLERLFGISSLMVYTAGGSSSDIQIPGLEPELAHSLRKHIIEIAGKQREY